MSELKFSKETVEIMTKYPEAPAPSVHRGVPSYVYHTIKGKTRKNCLNCKHLEEYSEVDSDGYSIGGGYHCNKQYQKAYESGKDIEYETNMERKKYLEKGKVCFEERQT